MPNREREYTTALTDIDHIKVRLVKDGWSIVDYSVRYIALIDGHWRKITGYDNAHGYAHRHVYYPQSQEYKQTMIVNNYNEAFTEAQQTIKKNFMNMRENYIILLERTEASHE